MVSPPSPDRAEVAQSPPHPATGSDALLHLQQLETRLNSLREHIRARLGPLESLPAAVNELAAAVAQLQAPPPPADDSLEQLIGYHPTVEQQVALFAALARFQAEMGPLERNREARFRTKDKNGNETGETSYRYADLAAVMALSTTYGPQGLSLTTRLLAPRDGSMRMVTLLLHEQGGALSSGVFYPQLVENRMTNANQKVAAAITTGRRLLAQNLLGVAAEEDSDFNPPDQTQPRQGRRTAPPAGGARARGTTTSQPTRTTPPPGWLPREEITRLEAELADTANLTPERFAEIEAKLAAHRAAVAPQRSPAQGQEGAMSP